MTSISRWQLALALAAVAASAAWIVDATLRNPNIPFLPAVDDPEWIGVHAPTDTDAIQVDRRNVPSYTFSTRFALDAVAPNTVVRTRSLGKLELRINGALVWKSDPTTSWKREAVASVAELLRSGDNEIHARVSNARGPALLQLRLEDGDRRILETDSSWRAIGPGSRSFDSVRASDTRLDPQSSSLPGSGAIRVRHAAALGLFFALGALGHLAIRRRLSERALARAPEAVLALATLFWLLVYMFKSTSLPVLMGFDIVGHLAYIDFLREQGALPLATDGGSMYHPPLGHALIAGLAGLFDLAREEPASRWLYRLPTFLAGLGNVWAVWFVARRLFDRDPLRTSLAVGFAGLLPMNVYMSAYVSNEPLHSFLVSVSLCIACVLLLTPGAARSRVAGLSVALGLAILTKFTALIAVPIVGLFLAAKLWIVDRATPLRALTTSAAMGVGVAAVGGWVYLRNWRHFGRPVVGNWDLPGDLTWWEQPGFHTADYYTSFGQSLSHPFFAGYASFWDGVYSTFWGDGLVAGMLRLSTRHDAWNYDFMTASYWLAFPATLALMLGFVRALRFCVAGSDLRRRLAMSMLVVFLYAACFALLAITFQLPYYAQAKAFYLLSAIVPLCLIAALGLGWVFERFSEPRWFFVQTIYCGWLGCLAGALILSFLG